MSEKSSYLKEFEILKIKLKGRQDFLMEDVCISSVFTLLYNQECSKVVSVFPDFKNLKC